MSLEFALNGTQDVESLDEHLSLSLSVSVSLLSLCCGLCSVSTLSLKEELWTALTHSCRNDFVIGLAEVHLAAGSCTV